MSSEKNYWSHSLSLNYYTQLNKRNYSIAIISVQLKLFFPQNLTKYLLGLDISVTVLGSQISVIDNVISCFLFPIRYLFLFHLYFKFTWIFSKPPFILFHSGQQIFCSSFSSSLEGSKRPFNLLYIFEIEFFRNW